MASEPSTNSNPVFQTPDPTKLNPNAGGESAHDKYVDVKKDLDSGDSQSDLEHADDLGSAPTPTDAADLGDRQIIDTHRSAQ